MPSAAALTACFMDEFPQKQISRPGGNSLNFALGCKKFGWDRVSLIGAVGNDIEGAIIRKLLNEKGICLERLYVREGSTARNKIYISDEGERYAHPEDWSSGVYQDFRLSEQDWDYVFSHDVIAINLIDPNLSSLLSRKERQDIFLTVNLLDNPDPKTVKAILKKLNLAFISCNKDEINAYRHLAGNTPIIFMLGSEGSMAFVEGKEIYQEALSVDKVIDTTGCGDAFQAAFCCQWYQTRDISLALQVGAEAGRKALSVIGGTF